MGYPGLLRIFSVIIFALAVVGGTPAQEPVLESAELFTRTGDSNKDDDTGVYAYVRSANGQIILASIENADSCGKDACEYHDHSEHTVKLNVQNRSKSQCQDFVVKLGSRANGNDKWEIKVARVTLRFSDGSSLPIRTVDNVTLNSKHSQFVEIDF